MITIANVSDLSEAMRQLPWADLSPVLGLGVIGLGLWLAGRRFLRAGLVLIGLLLGGVIGWLVAEVAGMAISPWIFVGVGAVLLACFAALMFRFAVAGTLAIVLALAAPTVVWTVGEWQGLTDSSPIDLATADDADTQDDADWLEEPPAEGADDVAGMGGADLAAEFIDVPEEAQKHIATLRGYSEWAIKKADALWDQTPENLRPEMVGAAIVGLLVGFLVGTIVPKLSASVVTSFGGALLILFSVRIIAERLGIDNGWWMPAKATQWLVVWLITSFIGTAIQWTFRPKPADNSA